MLKNNVYVHNPYSEESLIANIWNVMYEISPSQLWHVTNNVCESMKTVYSTAFKYDEYRT